MTIILVDSIIAIHQTISCLYRWLNNVLLTDVKWRQCVNNNKQLVQQLLQISFYIIRLIVYCPINYYCFLFIIYLFPFLIVIILLSLRAYTYTTCTVRLLTWTIQQLYLNEPSIQLNASFIGYIEWTQRAFLWTVQLYGTSCMPVKLDGNSFLVFCYISAIVSFS